MIGIPQDPQVLAEKLGVDPEAAETIPETAAVVLGDTLPSPDDPVPESNVKRASSAVPGNAGGSPNGEEAFDLASHPDIRKTIDKDSGDRSADTQRIVGACFRAGLRLPQIRWAVRPATGPCRTSR